MLWRDTAFIPRGFTGSIIFATPSANLLAGLTSPHLELPCHSPRFVLPDLITTRLPSLPSSLRHRLGHTQQTLILPHLESFVVLLSVDACKQSKQQASGKVTKVNTSSPDLNISREQIGRAHV